MGRVVAWAHAPWVPGGGGGRWGAPAVPAPLVAALVEVLARGERVRGGPVPVPRGGRGAWRAPLVLIDGRSGSGKSTLAALLARAARTAGVRGVQVARLDSWYPGWHGLACGSAITEALVLGRPLPGGPTPLRLPGPWVHHTYPAWDWERDRVARGVALDPDRPLLVEGMGALTPASARVADLRLWVEVDAGEGPGRASRDDAIRRRRALARDGEAYRPWWGTWAAEEDRHLRRLDPASLADIVVRT